ncbi:MAG: TolC family protein [Planctomycetes bacterium]|nr:TolC family protein [Planctomycetota bacterium]
MHRRPLPFFFCLALSLSGCATYREQPVDLAAFDAQWRSRHQQGDAVAAFARELYERGAAVPARLTLADGIDLAEAEMLTLLWNPTLRQARAQAGIAAAEAGEAGALDAPEIGFDALHALESMAKPWTLAAAVSFTLPLSGRLGLQRTHAERLAQAERERLLTQEWSTLAVLRDAWIAWSAVSLEQLQAKAFAEEVAQLDAIAARLGAAGELSGIAARAVRIAGLRAGFTAKELAAEAERQRLGLLALMGLAPDAPLTLHPALRLGDDLMQRLGDEQVPDDPRLREALAAHQVAEARLRLEIRRQYPDVKLGLGFEDDRGDQSLGPVIGFSIPLWNTNAQAIAGADATRAATAEQITAAHAAALHDRAQARVVLVDRRTRLAEMEHALVPLIDAQLADSRRLAGLGDLDVALLLEVFDAVWTCKRDLVRLRADLALAHNRLIALALPGWMTSKNQSTAEDAQRAEDAKL